MPRFFRFMTLAAMAMSTGIAFAQPTAPKTAPATAPTTAPAGRGEPQIEADMAKLRDELDSILTGPEVLLDLAKRQAAAPKAIPAIRKMMALFEEMAELQPMRKERLPQMRLEMCMILSVFGDASAKAELEKNAADDKNKLSLDSKLSLLMVAFWKDPKSEADQLKALDEMQKLAKANPTKDEIAFMLMQMSKLGAASTAVTDKALAIITTDLKGEAAKQIAEEAKAEKKMRDGLNKPIELAALTIDGKKFTTKDWKGKVILVDFWATWCGPCKAELPKVKKAYIDFHAKGLEILGVSCDESPAALKDFLDKNKDMPWPQLFDAEKNPKDRWHPIAKEWGITGIPTMFLIDKKGVLRSVDARQTYEEMIPKLLEEKE